METVRIGKVSKVDKKNGTVSVFYEDKGSTTDLIPYCCLGFEYHMPDKGDMVLVVHLSNGTEAGICLGPFWNPSNKPKDPSKTYRKDYGDDAYTDEVDGRLADHAKDIENDADNTWAVHCKTGLIDAQDDTTLVCKTGSITVSEIIAHIKG